MTTDPEHVHMTEVVNGESVHLMYVEVWDGSTPDRYAKA